MPMHNAPGPGDPQKPGAVPQEDRSLGYETSDVSVRGVVVFLIALGVSLGVFFIFSFGMGAVINNAIQKRDGAPNKWNTIQSTLPGKLKNMESSPALQQQQLSQLTQRFPTPRLQPDDGNQEMADMHAREDLLLDHYTWADRDKKQVRIPIERAMQLVAERGLAVAATAPGEPLMTADSTQTVSIPLTSGFARTGYEQEIMQTEEQQRKREGASASTAEAR